MAVSYLDDGAGWTEPSPTMAEFEALRERVTALEGKVGESEASTATCPFPLYATMTIAKGDGMVYSPEDNPYCQEAADSLQTMYPGTTWKTVSSERIFSCVRRLS